jgi:hypothetical protein
VRIPLRYFLAMEINEGSSTLLSSASSIRWTCTVDCRCGHTRRAPKCAIPHRPHISTPASRSGQLPGTWHWRHATQAGGRSAEPSVPDGGRRGGRGGGDSTRRNARKAMEAHLLVNCKLEFLLEE